MSANRTLGRVVPSNAQEPAPSLLHRPAGSLPPMPLPQKGAYQAACIPPCFRDTQGRRGDPSRTRGTCQFTVRTPRRDAGCRLLSSEKHLKDGPTLSPQEKMSKSSVNRRATGGSVRSGTDHLVLGSAGLLSASPPHRLPADRPGGWSNSARSSSPPRPHPARVRSRDPVPMTLSPCRNRRTQGPGQVPDGSTQCCFL